MITLSRRSIFSAVLALVVCMLAQLPLFGADKGPNGMFDAVAEVTGPKGTRSMPVTIEGRRPMPPE